jgi:hypothetical protein
MFLYIPTIFPAPTIESRIKVDCLNASARTRQDRRSGSESWIPWGTEKDYSAKHLIDHGMVGQWGNW